MYEKYITLNNRSTASIVNAHTQRNLELETKRSLSQVSSPLPWWFNEKENRNVGEGGRIQETTDNYTKIWKWINAIQLHTKQNDCIAIME